MKKLHHPLLVILAILSFELLSLSTQAQNKSYREIRIFIDADKSLVEKAGNTSRATQFISELIARVDAIYRSQLGITITLAGLHLWTAEDPFLRTDLSSTLASFAEYAETNYRGAYSYDVAHLLVGNGLGGEGGIAYQGSACGDTFSSPQAYAVSQPDLSDMYEFNAHLFAHELGHNLNADHDALPTCAVKTIMCLAQIGANFSDQSKLSISSYVEQRAVAGCFPPVAKADPISSVGLKVSIQKGNVNYKISGAQSCTSIALVGAPSLVGLQTIFGYLQIGALVPASSIKAQSKNALALLSPKQNKLYIGLYCDGQLAASIATLNASKIKGRKATNSAVLALRSLQKGFGSGK